MPRQYRLGEGPYGSAYQGDITDILSSGDLTPIEIEDRTFGLFLGRFDWQWTFRHNWKEAGRGLWAWLTQTVTDRTHDETIDQAHDLRFTGDQHHLVVAGTGAGKFRDALSNMLLFDGSCETSCLIIDPKGEIATTIGPMIDAPDAGDQRTLILDPWDVCGTGTTEAITFLEGLTPDNPHCIKDARILADAIIVHREGDGGHWDATAKNFLTALLLYLATDPIEDGRRHLRRLRAIVTLPWSVPEGSERSTLNALLEYLSGSEVWTDDMFGGIVARSVQAFLNREQKERSYILSTIERDTEFVEDPALWKALEKNTVDLRQLVVSNKRLHVVLPFDYIGPMRSWLRLAIAAYYNACLRHPLPATLPRYLKFRHIVIDEFAALGKLDFMVRDIAEARGAGIKHHLVLQSLSQFKGLYGDIWENFASNSFIQAFGISDIFTSNYLSEFTGRGTVVTETKAIGVSTSSTHGTSRSTSSGPNFGSSSTTSGSSSSHSTSHSVTNTFSTTGRPILMPDEVRLISDRQQLLFIRGLPVLLGQRAPYFEIFKDFLPRHTLKELPIFRARLAFAGGGGVFDLTCQPLQLTSPAKPGARHRASVNSRFRNSSFTPPPFRRQTFREAVRQDAVLAGALAFCFLVGASIVVSSVVTAVNQAAIRAEQEKQRLIEAARQAEINAQREAEWRAEAARREAARQAKLARMIPRPNFDLGPPKAFYDAGWCAYYRQQIEANKPYCTEAFAQKEANFMAYLTRRAYVSCNLPDTSQNYNRIHRENEIRVVDTAGRMLIWDGYSRTESIGPGSADAMSNYINIILSNGVAYNSHFDLLKRFTKSLYSQGCPFGTIDPERYTPPPETQAN